MFLVIISTQQSKCNMKNDRIKWRRKEIEEHFYVILETRKKKNDDDDDEIKKEISKANIVKADG